MTKEDCSTVASVCRSPWRHIQPIVPAAAGRIGFEQVAELAQFYGSDVVFILGSRIQQDSRDLPAATERFMKEVERCTWR